MKVLFRYMSYINHELNELIETTADPGAIPKFEIPFPVDGWEYRGNGELGT
jgi:hypothetical protein